MEVLSKIIRDLVTRHDAQVREAMSRLREGSSDSITITVGKKPEETIVIRRVHATSTSGD